MEFQKNEIVTVTIEDMGDEGFGIGKVNGFTLFVKDAVAGDTVEARIVKNKKKYAYARLEKLVGPSPFRVEPRCSYYRQCGGCQLQALSYEKQLAFKQEKIRSSLIRIGGFAPEYVDRRMEAIIGMEEPFRYRNKAQHPIGTDRKGNIVTGFYAGRTHDIIANTNCWLGAEENEAILGCVLEYMRRNKVSAYDEATGTGLVRHVLIRKGFSSGEIMVCLVINRKMTDASCAGSGSYMADGTRTEKASYGEGVASVANAVDTLHMESVVRAADTASATGRERKDAREFLPNQRELLLALAKIQGMTSVSVSINARQTNVIMGGEVYTIWGRDRIIDTIHVRDMKQPGFPPTGEELSFHISPLSFYQVNPLQTEKLYSLALEYANLTGQETVWDLYCGIGTISLFLAGSARKVCGVEIVPQAIADARENAVRNGIKNVVFFAGKAEEALQMSCEPPDVIVVDPPRKGCDNACLSVMLEMQPQRIVYVSCDPATLARDLRILCNGGYEITRIRGVDQFGMTVHVETVCLLSNRKSKPDTHVKLSLSMDDYYRIKEEGKNNQ